LGPTPKPQIPNPQSPIPNILLLLLKYYELFIIKIIIN